MYCNRIEKDYEARYAADRYTLWSSVQCDDYGKKVEEVIKDMKTDGPANVGQLIEALDFYRIGHSTKNIRVSKEILFV